MKMKKMIVEQKPIPLSRLENPSQLGTVFYYVVKKVTNSTAVIITQELSKKELDEYCDSPDWNVEIVNK